ncbi:MAG: hypothetical protein Kow0042_26760 [Calditrichia bacterium]
MEAKEKIIADPAAWVDLHGDYLFQYARLRVGEAWVAEDLVQDTFLAALKGLNSFRGDSEERTWLTGILKRKIIDYYRKRKMPLSLEQVQGFESSAEFDQRGQWKPEAAPREWGASPEQLLEDQQFMAALRFCLKKLPEQISGVFVLREMDGLNSKEICKVFGISTSNLWVILHRARRQLRRCLEQSWLEKDREDNE